VRNPLLRGLRVTLGRFNKMAQMLRCKTRQPQHCSPAPDFCFTVLQCEKCFEEVNIKRMHQRKRPFDQIVLQFHAHPWISGPS
jgi:hypothetical protein